MAAVTICSDFEAQETKIFHFSHFPLFYLPWNDGTWGYDLSFLMLSFKPAFTVLPSSRGSLVPLRFLPLGWYHLHCWGCWYFSGQSWFQLVIHPAQHFAWCALHGAGWQYTALMYSFPNFELVCSSVSSSNCCFLSCIELPQATGKVVWNSHLSEFSTVCCDPHNQWL